MLPQKDRHVVIGTLAAAAGAGGGTAVHAHKTSKAASRHERGGAIFALRARAMQVKVRLGSADS